MSSTSVQKIVAELKALPKADFEEVMTTVYGSAWTDRHEPEEELEECENCGELFNDLEDGHCEKCHECEDCGAHDMGFNDDSEWVCPHCEEDNKDEEEEEDWTCDRCGEDCGDELATTPDKDGKRVALCKKCYEKSKEEEDEEDEVQSWVCPYCCGYFHATKKEYDEILCCKKCDKKME